MGTSRHELVVKGTPEPGDGKFGAANNKRRVQVRSTLDCAHSTVSEPLNSGPASHVLGLRQSGCLERDCLNQSIPNAFLSPQNLKGPTPVILPQISNAPRVNPCRFLSLMR